MERTERGRMPMRLEVLLATMDQTDDSVLDSIAVRSDVIVCNQTSVKTDYKKYSANK